MSKRKSASESCRFDTIVIGAEQADLAVGFYLKQLNKNFVILDKGQEIGELGIKGII